MSGWCLRTAPAACNRTVSNRGHLLCFDAECSVFVVQPAPCSWEGEATLSDLIHGRGVRTLSRPFSFIMSSRTYSAPSTDLSLSELCTCCDPLVVACFGSGLLTHHVSMRLDIVVVFDFQFSRCDVPSSGPWNIKTVPREVKSSVTIDSARAVSLPQVSSKY